MSDSLIDGHVLVGLVNKKIKPLINQCSRYALRTVDPLSMLTSERFDLVPKIIYAEHKIRGAELGWPLEGYLAHLDRINGFVEADGSNKLGPEAFRSAFDTLIDDMAVRGFDEGYPIPMSNGAPLDGAHRIAAAIALGISVYVVDIEGVQPHRLSASDLQSRGVSSEFLDLWAAAYAKLHSGTRNVFVWPSAVARDNELESILQRHGAIVRNKQVSLGPQGKVNIIRLAYESEQWLGTVADGFVGAVNKSRWCFEQPGPLRVFLMEGVTDWLALKDDIRELFEIEKNSVHINDTHEETRDLSELIFNSNGLEFLNHHVPANFPWLADLLTSYEAWRTSVGADSDDYCLVGSSVLGIYGLREPRDLDFLALRHARVDTGMREIDCHNGQVNWGASDEQIVTDPRLHFVARKIKYIAPKLLIRHKSERGENKDLLDVESLTGILSGNVKPRARPPLTVAILKGQAKFIALKLRFYAKRNFAKVRRR